MREEMAEPEDLIFRMCPRLYIMTAVAVNGHNTRDLLHTESTILAEYSIRKRGNALILYMTAGALINHFQPCVFRIATSSGPLVGFGFVLSAMKNFVNELSHQRRNNMGYNYSDGRYLSQPEEGEHRLNTYLAARTRLGLRLLTPSKLH